MVKAEEECSVFIMNLEEINLNLEEINLNLEEINLNFSRLASAREKAFLLFLGPEIRKGKASAMMMHSPSSTLLPG